MDLDTIGSALRRKLGPLPVWIWAILGGAVVYFLRSKGYFSSVLGSGTQSADALQPSQSRTDTPQGITTLQPGESAYDPNTGALTTAPGGGTGADGVTGNTPPPPDNSDVTSAIQALTDAVLNNHSDSESQNASTPTTHKPTALARAKAAVTKGKIGPTNRARLEKAGYTDAQINYHLKRHTELAKPRGTQKKAANTQKPGSSSKSKTVTPKAGTHTPSTSHGTSRSRSDSHVKTQARKPNVSSTKTGRARAAAATPKASVRQRPTVGMVSRTTPVAHPQSAAHATAHAKVTAAHHAAAPHAAATHAPSAPPPRAVRAPVKKAPPPPPKKKK